MNLSYRRLFILLAIGGLSLGCIIPSAVVDIAEDALTPRTLYVNGTSGVDSNDCLSETTTCLTFGAALEKSNLNTVIHVSAGNYYYPALAPESDDTVFDLVNGLTVIGAGADQTIFRSDRNKFTFGVSATGHVILQSLGIDASGGAAGGIKVSGPGDIEINDCRIINAKVGILVEANGLAVLNHSMINENRIGIQSNRGGEIVLDNSTIENNDVGVQTDDGGKVTIRDSLIQENVLGIKNNGSLELVRSTLMHNTQSAVENRIQGDVQIYDSTIDNNGYLDALPGRGASSTNNIISNDGKMQIFRGTISGNFGRAIYQSGGLIFKDATSDYDSSRYWQNLLLDHVQITNNMNGDPTKNCALTIVDGYVFVTKSNIQDNTCPGVAISGGIVEISRTSIIGNMVGLVLKENVATPAKAKVSNSTIYGNGRFGIDNTYGGYLQLSYVTVTSARTSAIAMSSAGAPFLNIRNSVIEGACNEAPPEGRESFVCNPDLRFDDLGFGPLVEEDGTWVLTLLPGSPLIDAFGYYCLASWGNDLDQRDVWRPQGAKCDVGAYEFMGSVVVPLVIATPSGGVPGTITLGTVTPFVPLVPQLTFTQPANCRQGPSTQYPPLGYGQIGGQAQILGISAPAGWYYVLLPDGKTRCFVAGTTGTISGTLDGLSVIPAPQLPTLTPTLLVVVPSVTASPMPVPLAAPELNVSNKACDYQKYVVHLSWKDVNGEDGYRVYRDGTLIATLGAGATSYDDTSPDYSGHNYSVESFNGSGAAASSVKKSEGCLY